MRKVIYDVAVTLDGYICHEDGSCDGFLGDGDHVTDYLNRLADYDTVVMGRKTYQYGYQFGLEPGARAYPHMEHFVFSKSLRFDTDQIRVVDPKRTDIVQQLKGQVGGPIYLCGGGALAGTLLDLGLIDHWIVKLNPVIFGRGVKAFGDSQRQVRLLLRDSKTYNNGVKLLSYDLQYN